MSAHHKTVVPCKQRPSYIVVRLIRSLFSLISSFIRCKYSTNPKQFKILSGINQNSFNYSSLSGTYLLNFPCLKIPDMPLSRGKPTLLHEIKYNDFVQ